jgi:Protein of unknown function (DUF2817)
MNATVSPHFSPTYREAREKFRAAAARLQLAVQAHVHPQLRGAEQEELAMDVLRIGAPDAKSLLFITSATHGVEGFCGSGCQISLLHDDELLERVRRANVALVLVHAVNPYGFSHVRRVNEDSIDMNRNFLDFSAPLPENPAYAEVHPLMLTAQWPPTAEDDAAVERYIATHGARKFQSAVTSGQSSHPDGLFYAGRAPAWSNTTLRGVLREHSAGCTQMAWIDIHTGLGPLGHGEKIYAGRSDPAELARARACWGADVFSPMSGDSFSAVVRGPASTAVYDECPGIDSIAIGLEFGTVPFMGIMQAMRADQWLQNHPETPKAEHDRVKSALRDAFCIDSPEWRGMVAAQTRVAVVQALAALTPAR